ncbi:heterodisulfide reductase-related iron-sulfur binding cluster [Neptuniibacter sp. CAU 1671]|uniref:heterodisulfide reductase-related iron-sulfur binding cluster n=1 Tax=Neptuniibacter sp. CAU 1671 TaxID=3032593 RepID=UPI0023D9D8DF|nr:heterodisulfide reductase-related iron-sulfur binding cluster [Neptuniibacter sp. CAU 1671]MDF2180458.1 heterodisulfide reductase-related iron-sulfur binding cluster [Neptuniibacter sp. CAU 1671]
MASGEGNLEAPTRHPIDWQNEEYYDEASLFGELERVFDLCHGCRRCVSLCESFPTLFDLVDESDTFEVDGVAKEDYWKVVDHCYLCDLCYMTKCPYTPPHPWNIDFPHLMLRAKAVKFEQGRVKTRDKILTSTDAVGKLATIPLVNLAVNAVNAAKPTRKLLESVLEVDADAALPTYQTPTARKRLQASEEYLATVTAVGGTTGRVVLFTTCYGNYNEPTLVEDLAAVLRHNDIEVTLAVREQCCGMPKLELGDLKAVQAAKENNIATLHRYVSDGWDIISPVPSCNLMFKQELPLMFPDDEQVRAVATAVFDPFEYLVLRHKQGAFKTDFKNTLGKVAYQAACHQRVQNIGRKTQEILSLIPETEVQTIERCSGHDGTYAVKKETHASAMKIVKPVANQVKRIGPDYHGSDCPMAGHHIANALGGEQSTSHPVSLLRRAYGI